MQIGRDGGRIFVAVRRGNLPGAAADVAEAPAAFAERWIAQATRAPLTGAVPSLDAANGRESLEHPDLPELPRSAVPRVTVGAPAKEAKAMPKPSTIDVSAGDLADHLRRHVPPNDVALPRPSAVARHQAVDEARLVAVTPQHACRVLLLRGRQNAGVTDVVEDATGVIEPQDESRGEPRSVTPRNLPRRNRRIAGVAP